MVFIDDNENEDKQPFELPDAQRLEDEVIARIDADRILDSLSEKDRFIIEAHLLDGKHLNALSADLGYANSSIRGAYRRICEHIRAGTVFQEDSMTEVDNNAANGKQRLCKCGCGTPISLKGWPYAKGHTPVRDTRIARRGHVVVNMPRTVQITVTENHLDMIWRGLQIEDKAAALQSALLRVEAR